MKWRILSLILSTALVVEATTYYVATNGSNGSPGTITEPWQTISYAVSSSSGVAAGDTIMVRQGNYPEAVTVGISGNSSAPIVLTNYPDEDVTLDPGRIRFDNGFDHWKVNGLVFLNSLQNGLRVTGTHAIRFLTITNCTFSHHYESGVSLGGPDFGGITIEDCIIEWNGEYNGTPTGIEGAGIVMYGDHGKLWARRNLIANNWAKGISHASEVSNYYGDSSIVDSNWIINNYETGTDWWADNSFIRYNYYSHNGIRDPEANEWGDTGLALHGVSSGNVVAFNVIKSSGQIELWPAGSSNKYYNNTIIKDHYYTTVPGSPCAADIIMFAGNHSGNEFRNNLFVNLLSQSQHHFAIIAETYLRYIEQTWSNNLYWCPNASDSPPASKPFKLYNFPGGGYVTLEEIQNAFPDQEIGSLYDDPDFVSYLDSNFHLLLGSPAIDAGIDVGFPYYGGAPDMGAFEYTGPGIDEWSDTTLNNFSIEVYPNPFCQMTKIKFSKGQSAECIELRIYDATGRLIRQYDDTTIRLSDHIVWQGNDNFGQKLPAGVYFCQLRTEEFKITENVIKVR